MLFGASSGCYYPLETEKAVQNVARHGFDGCEVFFNCASEINASFFKDLRKIGNDAGMHFTSIHPFSSFAETHCLFGTYPKRSEEFFDFYKKHFELSDILGAKIFVVHGVVNRLRHIVTDDHYFEIFNRLVETGKQFGVVVAQENVAKHLSESPEFLVKMKEQLKDNFHLVFDVKQAVRAGYSPIEFAQSFSKDIVHVHISDNDASHDCLPPGEGNFDFQQLFDVLDKAQYKGEYIVEFYSNGLDVVREMERCTRFLSAF